MTTAQSPKMVANRIQIVQVSPLRLGLRAATTKNIFCQVEVLHGIVHKGIELVPPWPRIMKSLQVNDEHRWQLAYSQLLCRTLRPLAVWTIPTG
jgi:hypothetical protein